VPTVEQKLKDLSTKAFKLKICELSITTKPYNISAYEAAVSELRTLLVKKSLQPLTDKEQPGNLRLHGLVASAKYAGNALEFTEYSVEKGLACVKTCKEKTQEQILKIDMALVAELTTMAEGNKSIRL